MTKFRYQKGFCKNDLANSKCDSGKLKVILFTMAENIAQYKIKHNMRFGETFHRPCH